MIPKFVYNKLIKSRYCLVKGLRIQRCCIYSICYWKDPNECPKVHRKWKTSAYEASVKISSRTTEVLDYWEKTNNVLKAIENEIIEVFSKELGLMEDQLQILEGIYGYV
ncbi:hypothetical protein DPMN_087960 [Dreissena polymorpha]|uniref:Uncharacterized protein n=1 Tax=Dreissena polymorpha TaxID=45954 RepID=A0A9D4KTZ1_DREPO|nr:hypothetical protein DPMN_087960 [Dreissena polymorpha]